MMMMMMMEEEESEIEHVFQFVAHEIDLDYEFDAARFFDFTRPETPQEAHQAEIWFQNAATYPPSPFVTRLLVREDLVLDDVDDSPKSHHMEECTGNVDDDKSGVPLEMELSNNNNEALGGKISGLLAGILQNDGMRPLQVPKGLTFDSRTISESLNSKAKSAVPKSSTLMKPTASQLAKQNHCVKNKGSRFKKLLNQKENNLSISSGIESQAPKRQKLEGGGLLRKVTDVKPQTNFVHKTPMKAVIVDQSSAVSKLKLTIPREPDLKTAHRARRIRPKDEEAEHMTVAASRFKARPLNRRILDGPSLPLPKRSTPRLPEFQEFHLKTFERATQHTSAPSSSLHCNNYDKSWDNHTAVSSTLHHGNKDLNSRPTTMGALKSDGLGFTHIFKAQPLNKKNLSSKGDVGVFRGNKQEKTVPMEFELHTEKAAQHIPPIELFSKLSLASEGQLNNGSHFKLPQHSGTCRKEKTFIFGAKLIHPGNEGCISLMTARRSLGIR